MRSLKTVNYCQLNENPITSEYKTIRVKYTKIVNLRTYLVIYKIFNTQFNNNIIKIESDYIINHKYNDIDSFMGQSRRHDTIITSNNQLHSIYSI